MKGHKDHESRMHHEGKHKRASGGGIAQKGPHEEQTNAKKTEKMEHPAPFKGKNPATHEIKVEKNKGGRVERKAGGRVPGKEAAHRLDKRARGGAAKSPLSGADAPNLSYAKPNLKVDSEAKGKSIT